MRSLRRTATGVLVLLGLVGLLGAGTGCAPLAPAAGSVARTAEGLAPRGPGHAFASLDAAAVDALLYAHLRGVAAQDQRVRGGAIEGTRAGYVYAEPRVADAADPNSVEIPLGRGDVAHYHTYPRSTPDDDRLNESLSPADRATVEQVDPQQRPSYVLTPSLRVLRYDVERGEVAVTSVRARAARAQLARLDR